MNARTFQKIQISKCEIKASFNANRRHTYIESESSKGAERQATVETGVVSCLFMEHTLVLGGHGVPARVLQGMTKRRTKDFQPKDLPSRLRMVFSRNFPFTYMSILSTGTPTGTP